jgi:hypothetical protein
MYKSKKWVKTDHCMGGGKGKKYHSEDKQM